MSSFKVDSHQITKDGNDDFDPDDIVAFIRSAHENGKALILRSTIPTMDDKVVSVSAPVVHRDWIRSEDGQPAWGGTLDVAFREA